VFEDALLFLKTQLAYQKEKKKKKKKLEEIKVVHHVILKVENFDEYRFLHYNCMCRRSDELVDHFPFQILSSK
jgi:hypothetical protein